MKTNTLADPPTNHAIFSMEPRSKWWRILPLPIIATALLTPWLTSRFITKKETRAGLGQDVVNWERQQNQLQAALAVTKNHAEADEARVWKDFSGRLAVVQKQNRQDTSAGVASSVDTLVQASEIGWLIADYAQDKVLGGERAKARVDACSGKFTRSLKDSTVRTGGLIDGLQQDLASVNNRYAMVVGEIIEQQGSSLPKPNFDHLARMRQQVPTKVAIEDRCGKLSCRKCPEVAETGD